MPLLGTACQHLLVLDADLHTKLGHVLSLVQLLQRNPHAAMVCASSIQNVPDVLGEGMWSYYDSWALKDCWGAGGLTFAANPFRNQQDRWRWMAGQPVSVAAAFGGMALMPLALVRHFNVRWNGDQGCEHWSFCQAARQGGLVLACPTVQPLVIHRHPPRWSMSYAKSVQSQLAAY